MELISQSGTGADLLFCCFWHADAFVADNLDVDLSARPMETQGELVSCGYCAWCGHRLPAARCPLCRSRRSCAEYQWRMRSVAVDFARELRRRGVTITDELLDAGEERSAEDPVASGSELAVFVLATRRRHRPDGGSAPRRGGLRD